MTGKSGPMTMAENRWNSPRLKRVDGRVVWQVLVTLNGMFLER